MEDPTLRVQQALAYLDTADQAVALGKVLDDIPAFQAYVRKLRQDRVAKLHDDGLSWQEVGDAIGVHRNRAAQIAGGVTGGVKRKPEPDA